MTRLSIKFSGKEAGREHVGRAGVSTLNRELEQLLVDSDTFLRFCLKRLKISS